MANLITLARFPLLIAVVLLLYVPTPLAGWLALGLMVMTIILDTLDGVVARARKEVSLLGSVLDIMADRSVELVMWIALADLRLVPAAIPIIYVIRGVVVDSLRAVGVSEGEAPFKIMRSRLGKFLVGSPFMRTSYAISKLISFTGLILTRLLGSYARQGALSAATVGVFGTIFLVAAWISVAFCLARGIPVVVEAVPRLSQTPTQS